MSGALIALTFLAMTAGWQSHPQAPIPPQDAPPVQLEEVVVEGRTLREAVDQFVEEIVAPPVGRGPARWDKRFASASSTSGARPPRPWPIRSLPSRFKSD